MRAKRTISPPLLPLKDPLHPYSIRIILSMRVCSSAPAISIEFNDVESNDLAGYEERARVLYMIL